MTSLDIGFPLVLDRHDNTSLTAQLRLGLLKSIRAGALRIGVKLPSTRSLAAQISVSRPIVVEAYAQLASEGYLTVRPGARPIVAAGFEPMTRPGPKRPERDMIRYDLRPAMPDVGMFPRKSWLRAIKTVLTNLPAHELGYGDPRGSLVLREALANYLGRVRGVVADPDFIYITNGFAEARALTCSAFYSIGARRLAVEDPSYSDWTSVDKAGLSRIPVPVDTHGIDVDCLCQSDADAVFVTPSHQFPIGGVLSAIRRTQIVQWLRDRNGYALEDDYDAEFRYDQAPVGALQGLAPDRMIYAGTASKTLAPGLRLGWLVVPAQLIDAMNSELRRWSEGPPRIDQDAFAELITSGDFDRHLRKMRSLYRERRGHLLSCLSEALPGLKIEGSAAGLHITLRLPDDIDLERELAIVAKLRRHGLATEGLNRYSRTAAGPRRLFIGYGCISKSAIAPSVKVLADVIMSEIQS